MWKPSRWIKTSRPEHCSDSWNRSCGTNRGCDTAGVKRQYNGNRGKVENCVNTVALAYSTPGFDCLLDTRLYLPKEWANDPVRRKKTTFPTRSSSKQSRKSRWT